MKAGKPSYTSFTSKKNELNSDMFNRAEHICPPVSNHPVFVVDETFFRSRTPKATHWSIAWSDLMMTMFILFLTLFVYQLTHREFLSQQTPEILAGTSMPVPENETSTLPFRPINTVITDQPNILLKRLEPTAADEDVDALFASTDSEAEETLEPAPLPEEPVPAVPEPEPLLPENNPVEARDIVEPIPEVLQVLPDNQPAPLPQQEEKELITQIYDLSKVTLAREKLEKFAQVELIPDKTMRIILTGDLLFASGQAQLTRSARESLYKLIPAIKQTPYMINVIGHTDSIPMHSEKFASNWQLSTARASQVARFLIEEGKIPATQLVVSGYSFYRPLKPNTTAANRRANRRVEIILSKEPSPAQKATTENIQ
jgi:chemotaxis protein MotB